MSLSLAVHADLDKKEMTDSSNVTNPDVTAQRLQRIGHQFDTQISMSQQHSEVTHSWTISIIFCNAHRVCRYIFLF